MFGKLKERLKKIREKISERFKKGKEEVAEVEVEEEVKTEEAERKPKQKIKEKELVPPPEKPKKAVRRAIKRIIFRKLSPEDIEDIIWDVEVSLLESDVALPVVTYIIERLKGELAEKKIPANEDPKKAVTESLKKILLEVTTPKEKVDLIELIEKKKKIGEPAVFVFVGINGTGKTTTIAKLGKFLKDRGFKVVFAAADTFRAAGIEQIEIHAQRLQIPVIKQRRGADAAAVAYDAIQHAKASGSDVVLIDTAGRMQTDANLMDEMKKIVRVSKPDAVIFVGDALAGNDAVEQAKAFNEAVGITGSILCKMDADARGGAILSVAYVTGKPILLLGTGQGYDDLVEFKPEKIVDILLGD